MNNIPRLCGEGGGREREREGGKERERREREEVEREREEEREGGRGERLAFRFDSCCYVTHSFTCCTLYSHPHLLTPSSTHDPYPSVTQNI